MDTYQRHRHSVSTMHIHLVFVTKYRQKIFDLAAIQRLRAIFAGVCTELRADLVEMDGERDHVHLLVRYSPTVQVADLVRRLKGVSSRMLRMARPDIRMKFWKNVLWSPSHFAASCGGAPIEIVRKYIELQSSPTY